MKQGDYFDWEGIAVAEEDKHAEIPLKQREQGWEEGKGVAYSCLHHSCKVDVVVAVVEVGMGYYHEKQELSEIRLVQVEQQVLRHHWAEGDIEVTLDRVCSVHDLMEEAQQEYIHLLAYAFYSYHILQVGVLVEDANVTRRRGVGSIKAMISFECL